MDTKLVLGAIAVIVIGLGAYGISSNNKEAMMMEQKAGEEKMMMEKKAMEEKAMMDQKQMEGDTMMQNKDGAMMQKDDAMMMSKGSYEVYSPEKLAMAQKGKVLLFFKASWCPTCRTLDADIKANMEDIPAGVTILEVDYDTYGELKQKYGVTMQHTLVQVDASGSLISKWSGGNTLAATVEKIK